MMLLPTVLILTVSVSTVLAAFVTPNNLSPIKNCCDLGFRQLIFSQIVNKPKVYTSLKNFAIIFDRLPLVDIVTH